MNLHNYLQEKAASIEDALDRILAEGDTEPSILNEAMRYSVFAGGKRLRPILTIAAAEAVGGREEDVMTAACAIELIHTYSLIHDDLPAMDDDDYRRGRPTNHKVYGEALAILAGDALLTKAFEILAGCSVPGTAGRLMLRVIGEIAEAAGARGMVGGRPLTSFRRERPSMPGPFSISTKIKRAPSCGLRCGQALFWLGPVRKN